MKVAFITGSNRGLGRSIARHLSAAGVGVVGTYRGNGAEAEALERLIADAGGKAAMLQLDIGDASTFDGFKAALAETLHGTFGRANLDFVVQNAGNGVLKPFERTTGEDLDETYRVHFRGPFLLNQILVDMMVDGGRIINVSTAATRFYLDDHGAYAAMKAAVETATLYMAKELGHRRITVNVIAPGAVATDFGGGVVRDDAEINKKFAAMTPLGRTGRPDDIGAAVAGLLSENFGWLNGQRIELTGGQSL